MVNTIWVAQLLGKFVNACENRNALLNKAVMQETSLYSFIYFCTVNNTYNKKLLCNSINAEFPHLV